MSQEYDNFSKLTLNDEGFLDGIDHYMYASEHPAIVQLRQLLPEVKKIFPDAKGITFHDRYKISLGCEILEDNFTQHEYLKPTEQELATRHNLSVEQYKTLLKMMDSPMNTLPSEVISELKEKRVGSLDGVDEIITGWLKRQQDNK